LPGGARPPGRPRRHYRRHSPRYARRHQHAAHRLRPPGRRRVVLMPAAAADIEKALASADANLEQGLERLKALLRIKSISTDPAYVDDCQRAADWLVADLQSEGFEASARPTPGHPVVVAHGGGAGPRVLFYGHYDVQPVDPLDLWHSDPFAAELRPQPDGETHIVARGASDDKGQLLTFIEACRAWKTATGSLP